jgi:hypothetical protein
MTLPLRAVVEPESYDAETNTVDVMVRVRDVWSLSPGIGVGRSGGENKTKARIVDENFLGRGEYVAVGYSSSVDRSGVSFDFRDQNVFRSWWGVEASYNINSDGSVANLAVGRPFESLDSRWSAGMSSSTSDQITPMYDLGEKTNEFRRTTTTSPSTAAGHVACPAAGHDAGSRATADRSDFENADPRWNSKPCCCRTTGKAVLPVGGRGLIRTASNYAQSGPDRPHGGCVSRQVAAAGTRLDGGCLWRRPLRRHLLAGRRRVTTWASAA